MLKRGVLVLMMAVSLAGCDDDTPTEPADPNVVVFRAQLSAANEVPPITNAEQNARGDVLITMRVQRDGSNNITGATFDFTVNLNSFPANSTWTLAHIHEGAPGVPGGVRVDTGLTTGPRSRSRLERSRISASPAFSSDPPSAPTSRHTSSS
jgi:hypothetical protein